MASSTTVTTDKLYQSFLPQERLTLLLEAMAREDWSEANRIRQTCPRRTYTQGDLAFEGPREFVWDLSIIVAGDVRVWIGRMRMLEMFEEVCLYITSPHALAADMSFVAGWRLGKELAPLPDPPEAFGQEEGDYVTEQQMIDFATASMEAKRERGKLKAVEEDADEPVLMNDDDTLRAWEAPKKWIAIANRRLAGLYRPIVRRQVAEILGMWAAWDAFCRGRVGVDGPTAMRAHCPPLVDQVEAIRAEYPNVSPWPEQLKDYGEQLEEAWAKRFG